MQPPIRETRPHRGPGDSAQRTESAASPASPVEPRAPQTRARRTRPRHTSTLMRVPSAASPQSRCAETYPYATGRPLKGESRHPEQGARLDPRRTGYSRTSRTGLPRTNAAPSCDKTGGCVTRSRSRSRKKDSASLYPGTPGCRSQGATEKEAPENIQDAIANYLAVVDELLQRVEIREVEGDV